MRSYFGLVPLFVLGLIAAAPAQLTVVVPNGTATTEGNNSNAFPWGRGGAGLRHQCVYGAANFTQQGINTPITITRLRYRPNGITATSAFYYVTPCTVTMSTSPVPFSAATTTFANQTGPDATQVFHAPNYWGASPSTTRPSPWLIDVPLSRYFVYDPTRGDLNIDTDLPFQAMQSALQIDVQTTGSNSSRVYRSTGYPDPVGNAVEQDHGVVVEISYLPVGGSVATRGRYGTGCVDRASASFYQLFDAGTFDLSHSGIRMVPSGTGYLVLPGGGPWHTPVGANLGLTDNRISTPQPLGFTFNYPGGSTNNLIVSSNGFVWLDFNSDNGCCTPVVSELLARPARYCALWTDLDPTNRSVIFEVDAQNRIAWVTFTAVPEAGTNNLNTFQYAFHHNGMVEMLWQYCSVQNHAALVGWSPGGGARDTGNRSLSTNLQILLQPDLFGLSLEATGRPITGASVTLTTRNVPAGTPLGAVLFSLTRFDPGQSLASIGMPGCLQYVGFDFTSVFVPQSGTGAMAFALPNNTALSGMRFFCQSASFSAGITPLGVLASNGIDFLVGTL